MQIKSHIVTLRRFNVGMLLELLSKELVGEGRVEVLMNMTNR